MREWWLGWYPTQQRIYQVYLQTRLKEFRDQNLCNTYFSVAGKVGWEAWEKMCAITYLPAAISLQPTHT